MLRFFSYHILMALILFMILGFSIGSPINCYATDPIRLVGMSKVEIDKDYIQLKDLVSISGASDAQKEAIGKIEMGGAPPLGTIRIIDEKDIRLRLKRAQFDQDQIDLSLSRPISVVRASMEINPEIIKKFVSDRIKSHASTLGIEVVIKEMYWAGPVNLPSGKLSYKIQLKNGSNFIGKVPLKILFKVNGKLEKRLAVIAKIERTAAVAVALKPIARGKIVKAHEVELRSMELSKIKGEPIENLDLLVGRRAILPINPQEVILKSDVEIPPVLHRGDTVKIVVTLSKIIATAKGIAREDGKIGEKIKVINIDSRKTLYATVIDPHTVRIDF